MVCLKRHGVWINVRPSSNGQGGETSHVMVYSVHSSCHDASIVSPLNPPTHYLWRTHTHTHTSSQLYSVNNGHIFYSKHFCLNILVLSSYASRLLQFSFFFVGEFCLTVPLKCIVFLGVFAFFTQYIYYLNTRNVSTPYTVYIYTNTYIQTVYTYTYKCIYIYLQYI